MLATVSDISEIVGAICAIVGLAISLFGIFKSRKRRSLTGISLLFVGVLVFASLYYTHISPTVIPACLCVCLDEIEVGDTHEIIKVESTDKVFPIFSQAQHVKLILRGNVKDVDLSSPGNAYAVCALVRPPTADEVWFVQRAERDTLTPTGRFEVDAYLGGKGAERAQPGQRFGVAILIADFETREKYASLRQIPVGRPLSPVYRFKITNEPGRETVTAGSAQ